MVAPADGENKQFFIINGEVAEISFSENGVSYCYRASNTAEDLPVFLSASKMIFWL